MAKIKGDDMKAGKKERRDCTDKTKKKNEASQKRTHENQKQLKHKSTQIYL